MQASTGAMQVDRLVHDWLETLRDAGMRSPPLPVTAQQAVSAVVQAAFRLLSDPNAEVRAAVQDLRPLLRDAARLHTSGGGVPLPDYVRGIQHLQRLLLDQLRAAESLTPEQRGRIDELFCELIAGASEYWMEEFYRREDALKERAAALVESSRREEQARTQLANTVDDLRCVLDATINGIIVMDEAGRVRYVNRRMNDLFGVDAEGSVGLDFRGSLLPVICEHAIDREAFSERSQFLDAHPEEEMRDEVRLNGGEPRILVRFSGPVRGEQERLLGRIEVYTDVTAQRRAEQVKDEFLSIAAHELKTPITSLKGYAQLLQRAANRGDGSIDPARLGERLAAMLRQIDRLTNLVNDLLEVSRIQTGRMALRPELVDLGELVEQVVERFRNEPVLSEQHEIEIREVKRALTGNWDAGRLDQVLTNLLSNAIKYSPNGGAIQVRVGRIGDMARVSVIDHGIGIPAAEVESLFQPFARAANASVLNFGGIGLGLFISRDIIDRHGGRIWVESQEGKGSTFSFTLPLRHRASGGEGTEEDGIDDEAEREA